MAMHMAGTPISTMASVHCAAATENFIALEHHFTEIPFWDDFIDGPPKPLIQNGYIAVPDAPGLGFELNLGCRQEPTCCPKTQGSSSPRRNGTPSGAGIGCGRKKG